MFLAMNQSRQTPEDHIYQQLRTAIVEHRIRPATRLPEDALSSAFGVSRTGIRKVLQRLALERLVTLRRGRGAEVSEPTVKQAQDVFAARTLVECHILDNVIDNAADTDLGALKAIIAKEHAAQDRGDYSEAIKYSGEFHVQLVRIAGNDLITSYVEQLTSLSSLIIAVYGSPAGASCDCGGHAELLKLIAGGDKAKAQTWMSEHLKAIESSLTFEPHSGEPPDFMTLFGPPSSGQSQQA